jgi:hypothetical protein
MAFINIFDYKKYFSSKGDSNVARIGHVNKLAARVTSPATVTQLTSNTTDVTINSYSGIVRLAAVIPINTTQTFTVFNSNVTAESSVILSLQYSAVADASDSIIYGITDISDGSFDISVRLANPSAGGTGTPIKIHFLVIS